MSFIEFKDVSRVYKSSGEFVRAVDEMSFSIEEGEFVVIVGPSGAGKSTLLNLLGGMDSPTSGEITVNNMRIDKLNARHLTDYRRKQIGFVFQFYNLMPNLTAKENVELAIEISKSPLDAVEILNEVGLGERINNFPAQLSGGEQQRVSIARGIAKNSGLILCDEPTGALDYMTGKMILKILYNICKARKRTVILVTHNSALKDMADRVISIKNGKVSSVITNPEPKSIEAIEW